MNPAFLFAGASAALSLIDGLFGSLASKEAAGIASSRGRMLRDEAEADAARYAEQARGLRAQQAVNYRKSGVTLSGSPLAILDETIRVANENISAIRAGGQAKQLDYETMAGEFRNQGRSRLLSGLSSATDKIMWGAYGSNT